MKKRIIILFLFVIASFTVLAQSGYREKYEDIDLYYGWQEA